MGQAEIQAPSVKIETRNVSKPHGMASRGPLKGSSGFQDKAPGGGQGGKSLLFYGILTAKPLHNSGQFYENVRPYSLPD